MLFKLQKCFSQVPLCLVCCQLELQYPFAFVVVFVFMMSIYYLYPPANFDLKCIWSKIEMATLACFLGSFAWNIIFHPFTLVTFILDVKVCFLDTAEDELNSFCKFVSFYWGIGTIDVNRYQ